MSQGQFNITCPQQRTTLAARGYSISFDGYDTVVLERGRFGNTSLYYSLALPGRLVYATTLPEMRAALKTTAALDHGACADLLRLGYIPTPGTIYNGIRKVPANHRVTIDLANGSERFEEVTHLPQIRHDLTLAAATDELKRLLVAATERCLRDCGGKATALLSGGIDSGIVTAILQRHFPDAAREAFIVAYDDADYDETPIAVQTAQLSHIPLRVLKLTPDHILTLLPKLMAAAGEPFADSSLVACAMAYAAIPEGNGIFTGDGGDELFGGYRRYRAMALRNALPECLAPIARGLCRMGAAILPDARDNRSKLATLKRFLQMSALPPADAYASFQQICSKETAAALAPALPSSAPFLQEWAKELHDSPAGALFSCNALDLQCYLPEDGVRKCEIAASFAQCGLFSPLLDEEVADFALSLPQELRFNSRHRKLLLRNLAIQEHLLPEAALNATKRGFGLPLARWFRQGPLADQMTRIVNELPEWDSEHLLDAACATRILQEHQSAKKTHAALLWLIACLYYWKTSPI